MTRSDVQHTSGVLAGPYITQDISVCCRRYTAYDYERRDPNCI